MQICELGLVAFGPFSDRLLDFSQTGGGLHIVYGPNEAGKSSSLRGLKALLFGIPSRTTDNFLHENRNLRIAGKLRNSNGQVLAMVRRKGNRNTLLTPDGNRLDDDALNPYLHGVGAEIFEMLFGIDHEALVQGGREILEQKGEVGQALFSASMGSAALHGVLASLEEEADGLFRPRGSTQKINIALKEHARLQKDIRERSLSSREWGEARGALDRIYKELAQVQDELVRCKAERHRLRRISRAMPRIAARRELVERLVALGSVVVLPGDFGKRREAATVALEKAQAMANSASAHLVSLQEQIEKILVNRDVLEYGERIDALHTRLGGYRKAMQDRPHLEAQRSQLLSDAESLIKSIRPELGLVDAETLRPVLSQGVRISELGNQRQALTERGAQSEKAVHDLETQLQQASVARKNLAEADSPQALRRRVRLARKQGDLDEDLRSARNELASLDKACRDKHSTIGALWRGSFEEIPCLPLPPRESLDRFERAYIDLDQRKQRLRDRQGEFENTLREANRLLEEIQHAGSVPAEQDLLAVRAGRDRAWRLLRRQWLDGESVDAETHELDPVRTLPDIFESRIADADELADRLRREADRVQRQASLLATIADNTRGIEGCDKLRETYNGEQQQLDSEWAALWEATAIEPLPPREMRAWLDNMQGLQTQLTRLSELRAQTGALEDLHELHIRALQQELAILGEAVPATQSLETMLAECEAIVERIEEIIRQRELLDKDISTLERGMEIARREQQDAAIAIDTWRGQWQEVVGGLGLGADASPAEVIEMVENIRSLFRKLNDAENLHIRIGAMDKEAEAFHEEISGVVTCVSPELGKRPAEESVAHLSGLLSETGREETRRQQLEKQIQEAQERINAAVSTRRTQNERLDALCREAQCMDASELETAERRSDEFLSLRGGIDALEQELGEIGEGVRLTELEADADGADPDTLPGEIESLTERIDKELEPRKTALAVSMGEQQKELDLMDGRDDASALADEAQSVLEEIRSNTEQYVRVKLASRILRDEIERYRRQHQGPLLERASEHFSVLTQGSFTGLRADFNEKDEPVLVGVRPGGERVYVEGMSSGTRDQLYLSLRLASLEKYMESAEPMPFIVDDILVHFDDQRSRATLGVLAGLARKTQIILFTHHRRLVEQAQELDVAVPVSVHEL